MGHPFHMFHNETVRSHVLIRISTCFEAFKRTTIVFVGLLILPVLSLAQTMAAQTQPANDLSWLKEFVGSYGAAGVKDIKWDQHFRALMESSLRQRQFIWRDHGRLIPNAVQRNDDGSIAADGCVPHVCELKGMVWIDTAPSVHPRVIFTAMGSVSGDLDNGSSLAHIWLYSSTVLNWQKMTPSYLLSLTRWWSDASRYQTVPARVALVTLVQPTGEMVDLSPSTLVTGPATIHP